MRVLIDTNVLLDVLCNHPGLADASRKVWQYCEIGTLEGYICALSVPDIVCIMRKELRPERVGEILTQLRLIFRFADLKEADLIKAGDLGFEDYEDAVQSACAARIRAQYIVTWNIKDFKSSMIPAVKPEELLERL